MMPDGICHPVRKVLCRAGGRSFAQNLSAVVLYHVEPSWERAKI